MATPTEDAMAQCAACGKGGDSLKKCTACKLVKYCSIDCQRAHRPKHKKGCRRRAAELYDEALFRQPPSRDECPICFLELPTKEDMQTYRSCCGKIICNGCMHASVQQSEDAPCPFCREPASRSGEEENIRMEKRVEINDTTAIAMMGYDYAFGARGLLQDINKALELLQNAVELGSIDAHYHLGCVHAHGNGVQLDEKEAIRHWEIAAIRGHVEARYNLGLIEGKGGNHHRAMKHWIISASAGHDDSLKGVKNGYIGGLVTKDDFEQTLRAHKKSSNELKNEWRDKAEALADQDRVI